MISGCKFFDFFAMPAKRSQPAQRKSRADAQRNRERILEVAKKAFTRVRPGTLYRLFPTREELLQAIYRSEMEKLTAAERGFAQTMPPLQALRAWLLLFVDAIERKQIIAPALNNLVGGAKKVFAASYAQMQEAIPCLVRRAIKNGNIRRDVEPMDLLRALVGIAYVPSHPEWQQSAKRLLDILIAGSRPMQ
jgi:AcrR family transcriptional regulator